MNRLRVGPPTSSRTDSPAKFLEALAMNKADLVAELAEKLDINQADAAAAIEGALDIIVRSVAQGKSVTIMGFGTFEARERAPAPHATLTPAIPSRSPRPAVPRSAPAITSAPWSRTAGKTTAASRCAARRRTPASTPEPALTSRAARWRSNRRW
nr:HU family DNA-binding protein [Corynebacterium xerosis]